MLKQIIIYNFNFASVFVHLCLILTLIYITKADRVQENKNEAQIVGGVPALGGEFSYQVSIRNADFGHFCGGAILSHNLIITAGACTDPRSPSIDSIVAGSLYILEDSPTQQIRTARRIVPHPGYEFPPYYDISLIFLNQPFQFSRNISKIGLPEANQTTYPAKVVLAGWGNTQYGLPLSNELMKVTLDSYSDEYCEEFMQEPVPVDLLCVGTDTGGKGACQGDAGSAVVTQGHARYIAGILSHFPCPLPDCCGKPGPMNHNPEIAFYIDWIMEQSRKYGGGL